MIPSFHLSPSGDKGGLGRILQKYQIPLDPPLTKGDAKNGIFCFFIPSLRHLECPSGYQMIKKGREVKHRPLLFVPSFLKEGIGEIFKWS